MANEWVSPTGFNDPTGSWVNEGRAYDGDLNSPTTSYTPSRTWSNYLELCISSIYCSKIKFFALYNGIDGINSIDLDVYYEGAWHYVYQGSFLSGTQVIKTLSDTYFVSKMRVKFYNNGSDAKTSVLFEAMFYEAVSLPKVTTNVATGVSGELATLNGNITDTGGATCTVRGFVYKEGTDGLEIPVSEVGTFETGVFDIDLPGLDDTKKYYFRAYAKNSEGTGYGEWLSFGVTVVAPTVTTSAATSVNHEKATLNGNIIATGGQNCMERGFQYGLAETATWTVRETGTFGYGAFSLLLSDLNANTKYYFRAYAKNAGGIDTGGWRNFTTLITNPTVITHNATEEKETKVTGNGEIVKTGGVDCDEVGFEYGLSKVATWIKNEVAGNYGVGHFHLDITNLSANTEYWYRAYAKRFA